MNTQEYETVWSGATWRTYPAPQIASGIEVVPPAQALEPDPRPTSKRDIILAACSDDWKAENEIAAAVSMPRPNCNYYLLMLYRCGQVERKPKTCLPQKFRGPHGFLYRRVA